MSGPSNAARYFDSVPRDISPAAALALPPNRGYVRVNTGTSSTQVTSISSNDDEGGHALITCDGSGAVYFKHTAFATSGVSGTVCLANGAACGLRAGDFLELKQNVDTGQWVEVSRSIKSAGNLGGAVPSNRASDVFAEEFVSGNQRHLRLNFVATPLSVANTTGQSFGALKVYDFDAGFLKIESVRISADFAIGSGSDTAGLDLTAGGDFSVGSTPTLDTTIATTEENFIAESAIDPLSGGWVAQNTTAFTLDGTSTASDIYLNGLLDDADVDNAATDIVEVTGTIDIIYSHAGDV